MPKKIQPPQAISPKQLTVRDIDLGVAKLRQRITDLQKLKTDQIAFDSPRVEDLELKLRESVREIFGEASAEYVKHKYFKISRSTQIPLARDPRWPARRQAQFVEDLGRSVEVIEGLTVWLEEKRLDAPSAVDSNATQSGASEPSPSNERKRKVFVVHGRDELHESKLDGFLRRLRLEPVILHQQPNLGRTIIEKFEDHAAEASFAVVLVTPDDIGALASDPTNTHPRARQNVVFELGYFIARLGRKHVCALHHAGIELPSDVHGVLYVELDQGGGWKMLLARELKASGLEFDLDDAL